MLTSTHAPASREMVWVESGTLTLTVAAERHEVGPGQCARFAASRPHRYDNAGDQPAFLTMIVVIPPAPGTVARDNKAAGLTSWPWAMSQSRAA
jgi:quercetin dioxygenase-like cupin family protein